MCRGRPCGDQHEHWWNEGSTGDYEGRPYKKSSVRPPKPRLWDSLRIPDDAWKTGFWRFNRNQERHDFRADIRKFLTF